MRSRFSFRRLLSLALAVAMLSSAAVHASDALGHDLLIAETPLAAGTRLGAGTFWSDSKSDFRRENYVVYTPGGRVTPVVYYGETTRSLVSASAAAQALEAQGLRVLAGVNGDYFGVSHGVPIGSTMVDGVLRNCNGDPYYAVGFRADGSAVIGDPQIQIQASAHVVDEPESPAANAEAGEDTEGGEKVEAEAPRTDFGFTVFAFNHVRQSKFGVFLYDHNFNPSHTTGTDEPGVYVLCAVEGGVLSIGDTLYLRVEEVIPEATDTAVPEGKVVLTANLSAGDAYTAPLLALRSGDAIELRVGNRSGSSEWNDVVNLVAAPELLVQNGAVCADLPTGAAPRTAVGVRADGSVILYTIDGRKSGYSVGATLSAVGMRLVELGCVSAVAMDGGGSTALVATMPDETAAKTVGTPSDGALRAVTNHIFLVAPNTPSGVLDHIYVRPDATRVLPGAAVSLRAAGVDTNDIPMIADVSFTADAGVIEGNTLTAPAQFGTVNVTAVSGTASGGAAVEVVQPDWINIRSNGSVISSLALSPEGEVALSAEGVYMRLAVPGNNRSFEWSVTGDGLSVTEDGVVSASRYDVTGTLCVRCGTAVKEIPVTVSPGALKTMDDFETISPEAVETALGEGSALLSRNEDAAFVRLGAASARLDYTPFADDAAAADAALNYPLDPAYRALSLWLCGDGSGTSLSLRFDNGEVVRVPLDFTGWERRVIPFPAGASALTALYVTGSGEGGTLYLDQMVFTSGVRVDDEAPQLSLRLSEDGAVLSARAFDAVDGAALSRFSVTYDGAPVDAALDRASGAVSAALPSPDGHLHRVTITAGDASGNLSRASADVPASAEGEAPFPDVEGHWSEAYVDYLKRVGVTTGSYGRYHPDSNITRQEFAVMLFRYLGYDALTEDEDALALPFDDADKIDDWAREAVQMMYLSGVTKGTRSADGRLLFDPTAGISRQEAVTMLGRLLEKGYAAPQLAFSDSASVPDWAEEYVRALSALGVLGGYEDNSFRGEAPLTRAQIAAVLFRMN